MSATWPRTTPVRCPRLREAVSARVDGEDPGMADAVIDAHLARCDDCRSFSDAAMAQHRRTRVRRAGVVPDLSAEILSHLAPIPAPAGHDGGGGTEGRRWRAGSRRPAARVPARRPAARLAGVVGAVAVVAGAGLVGGGVLSSHLHHGGGAATATGPYPGSTVMAEGAPKPRVDLVDTAGQRYDLAAATAREVTLVYFGYTHCPDLCPINMALAAAAMRDLPAADRTRVAVVFITTDPTRDTPTVLRTWLDDFDPAFVGLTGTEAAIHAAEVQVDMPLSYAVPSTGPSDGRYQVVHAGYTLVYSQDGRAHLQVDDSDHPAELATTIEHLVTHGFQEKK